MAKKTLEQKIDALTSIAEKDFAAVADDIFDAGAHWDQRPDHRCAIARRKADIGAREHRGVGWFTLCNIPCHRAIFAESPEDWSRHAIRFIHCLR